MFTEYAPSQIETIFYRNAIVYNGGAAEKRMLFLVHFVYLICATISTFKGANKSPRPGGGGLAAAAAAKTPPTIFISKN